MAASALALEREAEFVAQRDALEQQRKDFEAEMAAKRAEFDAEKAEFEAMRERMKNT